MSVCGDECIGSLFYHEPTSSSLHMRFFSFGDEHLQRRLYGLILLSWADFIQLCFITLFLLLLLPPEHHACNHYTPTWAPDLGGSFLHEGGGILDHSMSHTHV